MRFLILYPTMICLTGFQYGLEVQPLRNSLKFVIGDPQVTFRVSNTLMLELLHDKSQIYTAHSSVVSPGFSQAVCTEVATQPHLLTYRRNYLPGLTSPDWLHETIGLCVGENEVVLVIDDFRIGSKKLFQPQTTIDRESDAVLYVDF